MYKSIANYIQTCDTCQRQGGTKQNELLHPLLVSTPFHRVGIDIVGPLKILFNRN
jgi:hypothetical protein